MHATSAGAGCSNPRQDLNGRLPLPGFGRELAGIPAGAEVGIGIRQSGLQADRWRPSHRGQSGRVQQLAWGTVRLAGVEHEPAGPAHNFGDQPGQFGYRNLLSAADVDRSASSQVFSRNRQASARSSTCRNSRTVRRIPRSPCGRPSRPSPDGSVGLAGGRRQRGCLRRSKLSFGPYELVGITEIRLRPYSRR